MKLNRLETHDRFEHFTKQNFSISECIQDIIKQRPFGEHAFYVFVHPRTDDDGVTKRVIWQPRLTRPEPQTNSWLFKVYPGTDIVKIIWMIPTRELWEQYEKGKITASQTIIDSINNYKHHREALSQKEPDDLSDEQIDQIYKDLSLEARRKAHMDKLYTKTTEAYQIKSSESDIVRHPDVVMEELHKIAQEEERKKISWYQKIYNWLFQ